MISIGGVVEMARFSTFIGMVDSDRKITVSINDNGDTVITVVNGEMVSKPLALSPEATEILLETLKHAVATKNQWPSLVDRKHLTVPPVPPKAVSLESLTSSRVS